ncbi:hypothetical protein F5B20DRAFT_587026 [Whalleya microplaca]|nr:hypothetical protein F5B20DRAFT_587026 [Whalleya microplaca]
MQLSTVLVSLVAIAAGIEARALQERNDRVGIFKTFTKEGCGRDYGIEIAYPDKLGKCQKFTKAYRAVQLLEIQSVDGIYCSFNVFDNETCEGDGYGTTTNMCINIKEGNLGGYGSWIMTCPS